MKIGIVSAQKHCKTHLTALRSDGYNVTCLGAKPSSIPPTYDVLVVRIESIRHHGSDVARQWGKATGKPVIYEDGLTGIRRELEALLCPVDDDTVVTPAPLDKSRVLQTLMDCADAYREARPDDESSALSKALTRLVYDEYGDHKDDLLTMIPSIVARHFPTKGADVAPTETIPVVDLPTPRGPFPADQKWAKVYGAERLATVYRETLDLIEGLSDTNIKHFMEAFRHCEANPEANMDVALRKYKTSRKAFFRNRKSIFQRRPMMYAMFIMLQMGEDEAAVKRPFFSTYKDMTGRGNDTRIPDAVAWFLGRPEPVAQTNQHGHKKDVLAGIAAEVGRQNPPAVASSTAVDSNTQAILEVLEEVERLTAKVKALEDFRNTQGPVGSEWEARIESQIKALEAGQAETLRQAQTGARQAVAEMREGLRGDIADAFDALASDHSTPEASGNPFTAIEQVKAMLKAAGFTGSLTLTIE